MNKVTVIIGGNSHRRFLKVDEIVGDRESGVVPDYVSETQIKDLLGRTEVIIFDEVNQRNFKPLTALINSNSLLYLPPYADTSKPIPRPELIILSNRTDLFYVRNFGNGPFIEYLKL